MVESASSLRLIFHGFQYHSARSLYSLLTVPLRLHSLTWRRGPSSNIAYWYREHRSIDETPILFIHGIGVGFYTYVSFLQELGVENANNGDVGVIALELTSISSRICMPAPSATEVKDEVAKILDQHGWDKIILVGHSYVHHDDYAVTSLTFLPDMELRSPRQCSEIPLLRSVLKLQYCWTRSASCFTSQMLHTTSWVSLHQILKTLTLTRR
jgi:hypothetical protein